MSFIKTHWFGLISGVVVFVFMGVFVLVLLSPRQDAQKRGFIPCTHELADRLLNCESDKKISCLFGAILRNTWCDMKVIGQGVANWFDGKQKTPWSNYIFIPEAELSDVFDTETAKKYLKNNPSPAVEMQKLQKLNKELEDEINYEEVAEDEKPQ